MSPQKARENWLRGHLTPEGTVFVDNGAVNALRSGASLLPVGVVRVDGQFARGAAVAIKDDEGALVGKGVTAYGSDDASRIAGLRSDEIEAQLGYRGRPALVHRDDLILES